MTEDEAKTKWCPFVRAMTGSITGGESSHNGAQSSYNRVVDGSKWGIAKGGCCIASACMAWRWDSPEIQRRWTKEGDPSPGPDWERDTEAKPSTDERFAKLFWRRNPQGFCGLAGAQG